MPRSVTILLAIMVIALVAAVAVSGIYCAFSDDKNDSEPTAGPAGGPIPPDREVVALIVPHAGYDFCAHVAACSYAVLKRTGAQTVFLIGSPHFGPLDGGSVYDGAAYETPLGRAPIDREAANILREASARIGFHENAHSPEKIGPRPEHTLEAQVPFIQVVLPEAKIVPMLYRAARKTDDDDAEIAEALVKAMTGRKAVLVISTDMSHEELYNVGAGADKKTFEVMKKLDPSALRDYENKQRKAGVSSLCGLDAVVAGFVAAKKLGADKVQVLKYANSGDIRGDKTRPGYFVGYGAVVLTRKKGSGPKGEAIKPESVSESKRIRRPGRAGQWYPSNARALKQEIEGYLAAAEKAMGYGKKEAAMEEAAAKELLTLARKTLEAVLSEKPAPDHEPVSGIAKEKLGCFVTLTTKKTGMLRGCIGLFTDDATEPLYKNVQKYAVSSALRDSRFSPVTRDELDRLHIEISVLSKNEPIENPMDLVPGKHGIIISRGKWRRGVYLPQVFYHFKERYPEKSEEELKRIFLSSCSSEKAKLSADAWEKDPEVTVYVFTATIIEEE